MWIALFPLINPITCATEYFGGIENNMCTWSAIRWPSSTSDSPLLCQIPEHRSQISPQLTYSDFRRYFGINTT